ncbi:polysaccharide deacetylase family protein [Clostridium sp. SHJSY1]|uniref:polysaccharide deacetylase family protein n=1 Tax=Clostridium sp. SHJSY1 TaxID=2942483 RepID=UPI002874DA89|nr:polysaccharide deacetylase family protein [Clostridium sp. SHJSY1]MDS0525634.1 polysaccharide deacetylase family protein [Clostridium sp. SHJSY1]
MSKAYLTIDDGPTKNTKKIVDFLVSKNIPSIMFFTGENILKYREEAIYALKKGVIIGNHSFTHVPFSQITLKKDICEIESQEKQLDLLYKEAKVTRKYKIFRFPYGDKGGKNKKSLQSYLKYEKFNKFNSSKIKYHWYFKEGLDKDIDVYWTFDFIEYKLEYNVGFTFNDIFYEINDKNPNSGGVLLDPSSYNIVLIHDHEKSEEVYPDYFSKIIDYTLKSGVKYMKPKFITSN